MRHQYSALRATPWIAAAALALPVLGQESATSPSAPAAVDEAADAEAEFAALEEAYRAANAAFREDAIAKIRAAEAAGEPRPNIDPYTPARDFIGKFKEGAARHAGSEGAVGFNVWIVNMGGQVDKDAAKAALTTLLDSHVKSPGLAGLSRSLGQVSSWFEAGEADRILARFEEEAALPELRAWATFSRHFGVLSEADVDSEAYAAAKTKLTALAESQGGGQIASQVESQVALRETFALGAQAPDITGFDLDGEEFKLSEYAGKVIFLDFWGNW